ncbi:P13 family porin, partial [Anaeromyxobacter sp. SG64]|uniref:P13 family porin n=1 Tax=Anaeromyxobacter sp. SG64 TaxID=2925409 RepID=UPI001F598B07
SFTGSSLDSPPSEAVGVWSPRSFHFLLSLRELPIHTFLGTQPLLDGLEEGIRWWAPLLNLYPGYGLGSLASRDPRGAWLAAADFAGSTLFFAGVLSAFGTSQPSRSGSVLLGTGAALILGSRVGGVILPFTFSGRRHREAERALRALPPPVTAMPALLPIAPGRGAPGAALGVALRY